MTLVTVVIPTVNKKDLLERCLSSLKEQAFRDFETIVIDNSSNDGTSELVSKKFPEVKLLKNKKKPRFCCGKSRYSRGTNKVYCFAEQ